MKTSNDEDVMKDLSCCNSTDCLEETCSVVLKEERKVLRSILHVLEIHFPLSLESTIL